jgi:predicted CoA-binding protein
MTGARSIDSLEGLRKLLDASRTIAVVGLSDQPDRESHQISAYLQARGYRIIGVNPSAAMILGEPCYPSLEAIPGEIREEIDFVAIFRKPDAAAGIAEEASRLGFDTVWLVPGSFSREVEEVARARGLAYVPGVCLRTAREMTLPRR